MRNYQITVDSLNKLADNFYNSPEENADLLEDIGNLFEEFATLSKIGMKSEDDKHKIIIVLHQLAVFALFCREYIDVIHDLITMVNVEEIPKEECVNE